jgi:glycosyltransferase involved in cell wall biosynthesis
LRAYAKSGITQKLLLLGDGPLKDSIQQLANELGIAEKIIFAGFHDNPYPIINDAKLSVLTSDYEGLPTVLIESLALKVPVLSTDCPSGPREILTGPLTKYLIGDQDVNEISEKIKAVLQNTVKETTCDTTVLAKFEPKQTSSLYLSLIQ